MVQLLGSDEGLDIEGVLSRLDEIDVLPENQVALAAEKLAAEQLKMGEVVLETWLVARDNVPADKLKEGFRLLALHAQGAKGVPSFNACRETCREIVFQHNVIAEAENETHRIKALRMMAMVVRHLALFVSGKLEVAGLGDFCCASKPLHQSGDTLTSSPGL